MMNKKIYIANWKMNISAKESENFLTKFIILSKSLDDKEIIFCPSFTTLPNLIRKYDNLDNICFGAQNVGAKESGAYTGEVSASMLKELSCKYCIIGHSERRELYHESNSSINQKIKLLIDNNIIPILCVGETLEEKEQGQGDIIVTNQLSLCLDNVEKNNIIIAYEPVWAIGTGKNATIDDISRMNETIGAHMNKLGYINEQFYILYGGSVNINNLLDIKEASLLNGFLIGGASLDPDSFWKIVEK